MGTQRVIQIDAGGKPAKVVVTEVTPGRWAWVVRIDGEPSLSSRSPSPTGQAAINCALAEVRALTSPQADTV